MYSQPVTVVEHSSASESTDLGECTSLPEARRSLKITNAVLFDLIAAGEIRSAIINGRRTPEFAVSAAGVERLRREFEESIICRDVARELGTDCGAIRELAKKKSIRPLVRRSTDAFKTLRFGPRVAEELLRGG